MRQVFALFVAIGLASLPAMAQDGVSTPAKPAATSFLSCRLALVCAHRQQEFHNGLAALRFARTTLARDDNGLVAPL